MRLVAAILALFTFAMPLSSRAADTTGVRVVRDIAYVPNANYADNKDKLDLYLPEGRTNVPVIVSYYGGALMAGDKSEHTFIGRRFASAQQAGEQTTVIDSIDVRGTKRLKPAAVLNEFGIATGRPSSYRDIQRGIDALYLTGQYTDVRVSQATIGGKEVLRLDVVERPLLTNWSVRGAQRFPERTVRNKVSLVEGRPYNPAEARRLSDRGIELRLKELQAVGLFTCLCFLGAVIDLILN